MQEVVRQSTAGRSSWRVLVLVSAVTGALVALINNLGLEITLPAVLAALSIWSIAMLLASRWQQRQYEPASDGSFYALYRLSLSPEGLQIRSERIQSSFAWASIRRITSTEQHVYLWVDTVTAIQVPVRSLPPELAPNEFVAQLRQGNEPSANALGAGATRPRSMEWLADTTAIPSLAVLAIAILLAVDFWAAGPNREWYGMGIGGIAWYALGALGLAGLLHRFSGAALPFRRVLRFVFEPLPVLALLGGYLGRDAYVYESWVPIALGVVAVATYSAWRMRLQSSAVWIPAGAVGIAFGFLFAIFTSATNLTTRNWYAGSASEPVAAIADIPEDRLHFNQAQKVDAAVAKLEPRSADKPNLFVVGFAGYGNERVFAEEVKFAIRTIGAKWSSASRSLLLVNDRRDLEAFPLASVAALERALQGVGARMDPEQDVLLLFLSSHGSEDATLSVENLYRTFEPLSAASVAQALERAGIRRRIVIISACHSGSFIPALKNADTIVLTAAAADRTSFGCSDDRNLTYFGEAFFRDALPKAASLRAAFDEAKTAITARERAEKQTASKPQAWFGAEMNRYWASHFEAKKEN